MGLNVDRVRTRGRLRNRLQVPLWLQVDPSRWLPRVSLDGFIGQDVDLAGGRVGTGGSLRSEIDVRPTDHLDVVFNSALSWLDVPLAAGGKGRLFTAQVQRLRATYMVTARASVRLVGQYVAARYAGSLYPSPMPAREGDLTASALLSYRLNWQTAVYAGYGDRRALDDGYDLARAERQLFVKASYSFQR